MTQCHFQIQGQKKKKLWMVNWLRRQEKFSGMRKTQQGQRITRDHAFLLITTSSSS
jgi:hypothetical protein